MELIVKACPADQPDVQADRPDAVRGYYTEPIQPGKELRKRALANPAEREAAFTAMHCILQPHFGTFAEARLLHVGGIRSKRKKGKAMTQSKLTLALAMALSLGLIHSSPTPVKETPLSKSDIVIAQVTRGQDSAKIGESSGTKTGSGGQA